jgi:hypothetical protein
MHALFKSMLLEFPEHEFKKTKMQHTLQIKEEKTENDVYNHMKIYVVPSFTSTGTFDRTSSGPLAFCD